MGRRGGSKPSAGSPAIASAHGYFNDRAYFADDKPILPQRLIGELSRGLPEDAIVTCDAGENRIMMTHFYQTKRAEGFLAGRRLGADGVCHSRRSRRPSSSIPTGRSSRYAATAGSR